MIRKLIFLFLFLMFVLSSFLLLRSFNLITFTDKEGRERISPEYNYGYIEDSYGFYLNDKTKIVSERFNCSGLLISVDDDSEISYKVYFYDKFNIYLGCSEVLKDDYTISNEMISKGAISCRVVIDPSTEFQNLDTDVSDLNYFDMLKLKKVLTIKVVEVETSSSE